MDNNTVIIIVYGISMLVFVGLIISAIVSSHLDRKRTDRKFEDFQKELRRHGW